MLFSTSFDVIVVDVAGFTRDAVGDELVELAGEICGMSMCEMSAMSEVHTEYGVAGLEEGEVDGHVCLRAAMRLHIGILGAVKLLYAVACKIFDDVDKLASAIVTLSGIAFGVLIRKYAALRFEHGARNEIFACNEFKPVLLAFKLML